MANISGDSDANILNGTADADQIFGLAGNDILQGGSGADALDGGADTDTATYAGSVAGVTVNLASGLGSNGDAQGDTLTGIENVTGSDNNDILIGDGGANVLDGGVGDDMLIGGGGGDMLIGGDGIDTVDYSASANGVTVNLVTGAGAGGDAQGDTLTDVENLIGSDGNDNLTGSTGANRLEGGLGDDTLTGGAGADEIVGGDGSDTASYAGSAAGVTVNLATGAATGGDATGDTLDAIENVTGSGQADTLTGDDNANVLSGGNGDDTLTGGVGNDTLTGGGGTDTAVFNLTMDSYAIFNNGGMITVAAQAGSEGIDTLTGIERIQFSDAILQFTTGDNGNNTLTGIADRDTIFGLGGDDTINGLGGNDVLAGGRGVDTMDGGDGEDWVSYEDFDQPHPDYGWGIDANLTTGVAYRWERPGSQSYQVLEDNLSNIENIRGSIYNYDVLTGNAGDNKLEGGAGADTLYGGAGNDTAVYEHSSAGVTVDLSTNQNTGGDAAGDSLYDIENLWGSAFADTLTGDAKANILTGRGGDDSMSAGDGDDLLLGGAGADILDGGNGRDWASYVGSDAIAINLAAGTASGGDAQGDTLTSIENLRGGNHADTLTGSSVDNIIEGGAGADIINGGDGVDTADYLHSSAAVTVNLTTGVNTGSDAAGDTLAGIENLRGSAHGDTLTGDAGDNVIEGGAGADAIDGAGGADWAAYDGSTVGVTVSLASGTGTGGDAQGDTLTGIENLHGSAHADTLTGDAGDNVISGGRGIDTLDGGDGEDWVSYEFFDQPHESNGAGVDVNLATGIGQRWTVPNPHSWLTLEDNLSNFENIRGSRYNYDVLTGNAGDNKLEGGAGMDTLIGGAGSDWAVYEHSSAAVSVNLSTNQNTGGDAAGDSLYEIENLWGSAYADTLLGDAGVNALRGDAGADMLDGGVGADWADYTGSAAVTVNLATGSHTGGHAAGDTLISIENLRGSAYGDILTGDNGNNLIEGRGGADTVNGGGGVDTADYATSASAVTVNLGTGLNTGGDAAGDSLTNIENLRGSIYGDMLTGDGGNNMIEGGAGADAINGGGGSDWAIYAGSTAAVTINLATGTALGGHAQGDTFASIENVEGSIYDDTLTGDGGNNILSGGRGQDTIDGAGGEDWISYASFDQPHPDYGWGVEVNLSAGTSYRWERPQGQSYQVLEDNFSNIENIRGSDYGNDVLTGSSGDNKLDSGKGSDTLTGGEGNDTYIFARGDGFDTVYQYGITDGTTTTDIVQFASGVSYDQLWFQQDGWNLLISVIGEPSSSVYLRDFFADTASRIDSIQTVDGNRTLSAANVQDLVNAMASYSPPSSGQFTLDPQVANDLAPVFATTWA